MKDHILFDPSNATTILDTDSLGAWIRAGDDGTLITHTGQETATNDQPTSIAFVDGDVIVGDDSVTETAHGYNTGDKGQLTSSGTLPAGLALATDYWIVKLDDDTLGFATSLANAIAGTLVDITAAAGGGTHTFTLVTAYKQGLDAWILNPSLTTTNSANHDEDTAHTTGDTGSFALAVRNDTEGTLVDTDGDYAPLQVDSSGRLRVIADLDSTNLAEKDEDSAHVSGDTGSYVLTVREDSLATSTSTDGDYQSFKTNAKGELYTIDTDGNALLTTIDADTGAILLDTNAMVVDLAAIEVEQLAQGVTLDAILTDTNAMVVDLAAIEVEQLAQGVTLDTIAGDTTSMDATLTALSKSEDAVHVSGDQGIMSLAVRNDTLASLVDTDGDYAPLQVNATGALYVTLSEESDSETANTAIANAVNTMTVANTAEDAVASPLANRKYLFMYNNGNKKIYTGATGVSAANGFPLSPGSVLELRAGAAIDIEWVSADTAQEIRTLELS